MKKTRGESSSCSVCMWPAKRLMSRNKKAQGLSSETIILLLIAVVVLVIVILGFTRGWDYIFGKIGLLPGNLEAAAQSCGVSGSQALATSYCYEFKEIKISDEKQYVNCEYLQGFAEFEALAEACNPGKVENLSVSLCKNKGLEKDKKVNGKNCLELNPGIYEE